MDEHTALASPVRTRIVQMVREGDAPLTAGQLATALDLHVTTVRFHLEQLEQAGLVVGVALRAGGRGRPRIGYRPGALDTAVVREQMIDALAEVMADPDSPDLALEAGLRWAQRLPGPTDATGRIAEVFTQLGFAPEPVDEGFRLRTCPFIESAHRSPGVVCRVHLGLAQGLAARADVDLIPFEGPEGCLLTLTPREGEPHE